MRVNIDKINYNGRQYKIKVDEHKKKINAYKYLKEFIKFINESSVSATSESEWKQKARRRCVFPCLIIFLLTMY